jgi:predicted DNA-binding transcriptional regulator YafY
MGKSWQKRDRTARLLKLQIVLWQHPHGLEIKKLAEICDISVRTVYRDLEVLETELGVPIWEEGTKRGVSEGYFLPPITLSLGEATYVFLAARMMQKYFHYFNPNIASMFAKLNAIVPDPLRQQVWNIIAFMQKQPKNERKISNLSKLVEAWLSQHQVIILYQELSTADPVEFLIDPYFIEPVPRGYSYYIIAYCHAKGSIQTFKIDRIVGDVVVCPDTFKIPSDFNAVDYLGSAWGTYLDADVQIVKLKFDPEISKAVMETTWHPSQINEFLPDGSLLMTFTIRVTFDFRDWTLSWGDRVEVLEPESLRTEIIRTSKSLVKMYSNEKKPGGALSDEEQARTSKSYPGELTDEQWKQIESILPSPAPTGRPRIDNRKTINGILWILKNRAAWSNLPRAYGAPATGHSRFQSWKQSGDWDKIEKIILSDKYPVTLKKN